MSNNLGNKQIMAKNILYYMEKRNKTRQEMCEALGVKYTTFTDWVKGNSYPRIDKIELMANYFGISKADLVEEHSSAPNISGFQLVPAEINLLKKYNGLDSYGKEMVDLTLDKETERIEKYGKLGESSRPVTAFPMRLISYYFKNASAGTGQLVIDNLPDKDIEIPDKPEYRNVSYAIGVNGSSMEPAFQDGDILLVEATQEIEVGDVGIFQINNECFVKKLGEKELISLNKDYKNIPLDETAATLGKVIGKL